MVPRDPTACVRASCCLPLCSPFLWGAPCPSGGFVSEPVSVCLPASVRNASDARRRPPTPRLSRPMCPAATEQQSDSAMRCSRPHARPGEGDALL